ncbi:hypothetical protein [Actinomadura soli]|uniref:hypothetical protein n=1 Tax=Actinomadura soli TaxID=2508997 RepID=UPI0014864DC2|nr:hypothetical protein [Actinomadura soli]
MVDPLLQRPVLNGEVGAARSRASRPAWKPGHAKLTAAGPTAAKPQPNDPNARELDAARATNRDLMTKLNTG